MSDTGTRGRILTSDDGPWTGTTVGGLGVPGTVHAVVPEERWAARRVHLCIVAGAHGAGISDRQGAVAVVACMEQRGKRGAPSVPESRL